MTVVSTSETEHELLHRVEAFFYDEAEILDERRYRDWLALLTDDVHYWLPAIENYSLREQAEAEPHPDRVAHYDEDLDSLRMRIRRLETNMAWAEDPPSRTRRFISNVRILGDAGTADAQADGAELEVRSNILVYQNRLEREVNIFSARRHDTLRLVGSTLRIARRLVLLDQSVVLAKSMNIFF